MFRSRYTKGQAEMLKNSHGISKPLPSHGAMVICRSKAFGGGLIRLSPTEKPHRYMVEVLTEAELQEALQKTEVA